MLFVPDFMLPETLEFRFEKSLPYAEKPPKKKKKKKPKKKKSNSDSEPEQSSSEDEQPARLPTLLTLKKATQVRNRMKNALEKSRNTQEIIKAIEDYLPYIFTIVESNRENPKCSTTWTTAFMKDSGLFSKRIKYTAGGLTFELIMVLWAHALALNNEAAAAVEAALDTGADMTETRKLAIGNFKRAAGIVQYLLDYEIPHFSSDSDNVPPEVNPANAHIFVSYFCGLAQVVAVHSAVASEKSLELVARLCVGVYQKFDEAFTNYGVLLDDAKSRIVENLPTAIAFYRVSFRCEAYKYLAKDCVNEEKAGEAVSFINTACEQAVELKKFESKSKFKQFARRYRQELVDTAEHYRKENSLVYHQPIPASTRDSIPEPIDMMKPTPFVADRKSVV